jgi:hypothetical protein
MRMLPGVLYGLAGLNAWIALQLPHAALMHWLGSSVFTLGLQTTLQQPSGRALLRVPSPADLQACVGPVTLFLFLGSKAKRIYVCFCW